jgi:hypothetical protein
VLEYSDLPEEPPLHAEPPPPANWPDQGEVCSKVGSNICACVCVCVAICVCMNVNVYE